MGERCSPAAQRPILTYGIRERQKTATPRSGMALEEAAERCPFLGRYSESTVWSMGNDGTKLLQDVSQ
eukprot:2966394-Rhodomonas_salina.3